MSLELTKLFKEIDFGQLKQVGHEIITFTFKPNKKTCAKTVRALCNNGYAMEKTITSSGVEVTNTYIIPVINSIKERNTIIKDLAKQNFTQDKIAALLNVSQSTVSRVLKKK